MQQSVFKIEKLRRLTLYGISALLLLLLTLIILLQTSYIQTKITNYITKELSDVLKTEIDINSVNISLFKGFKLNGILMKDINKDTMIYINKLYILPKGIPSDFNKLSFQSIEIGDLFFDLHEIKKDTLNLDYVIDAILTNEKDTLNQKDFSLKAKHLIIKNSIFKYKEIDSIQSPGIDYEDMEFSEINAEINNIDIFNDKIKTEIKKISAKEKSGLFVKNISTENNIITPDNIRIKNLDIETSDSHLAFDSINLKYPDRYYFSDYKNSLLVQSSFKKQTHISFSDLSIFMNDTVKQNEKIFISGSLSGKYKDFKVENFKLNAENILSLHTNSRIINFPTIDDMEFNININDLTVNIQKLNNFTLPGKTEALLKTPEILKKFNSISYKGITSGKSDNFSSKGILNGNFGKIIIDAIGEKDTSGFSKISGKLSGNELNINKVMQIKDLKNLSVKQNFTVFFGKNKNINAKTEGTLSNLKYKNHIYKTINLFASLKGKKLDSININISEPAIKTKLTGSINFEDKIPKILFNCNIAYANLSALGFKKEKSFVSADIKGNFKGFSPDDFTGTIKLKKPFTYKTKDITAKITRLLLTGTHTSKDSSVTKNINLISDIADIRLKSSGNISESLKSAKNLFKKVFSDTIQNNQKKITATKENILDFSAVFKKPEIITQIFIPNLRIDSDSKIFGFYQPEKEKFNLSFNSGKIKYKELIIKDFYIISYTSGGKFFVGTGGSSVKPNDFLFVKNFNLGGEIKKDTVNFNLSWNNFKDSAEYSANINGKLNFKKNKREKLSYHFYFGNSDIVLNDTLWNFNNAALHIDSTHININNLRIKHNKQEVYLDGNISEYQGDMLYASFKNLDLKNFNPLFPENLNFEGQLNGFSTIADIYSQPLIFIKDSVSNFKINEINFGKFYMKSYWDNASKSIRANAYNLKGKHKFMNDTIYGEYFPDTKTADITLKVKSMLLKTFKEYYKSFADFNNTAFLTGELNLSGKINNPKIKGNFKIKQATTYIKYLNTYNNLDELSFTLDNKNIHIEKTKITPGRGKGTAFLSGNIRHKNFTDFSLNIDILAKNYEILNIAGTDTSYYFGNAFGSGNINLSGPFDNIFLDADLKTEKNTQIFIPISAGKTYNEEKTLITFKTDTSVVQKNKTIIQEPTDISGFSMNLKLKVTPDADIEIIPDENSGNIKTVGNGDLSLILEKNGDFNIYGTYFISEGKYDFNVENIIRKTFTITDGSNIEWFGKPEDAIININAVYSLNNITLSDLTQDPNEIRRVKTDCNINITGKLLNPEYKLSIHLPDNLNEYTAKLNNLAENERNEQFLSLLLLGVFQPLPGIKQENITNNTVTGELLSKQLNSFLKKIKYVDVNLDYISGNPNYSEEYKIGVKKKFLNDRIEIKGNFGIGGQETEQTGATNYIGEFELEAKLNKSGTFRGKAYNKANDKIENDGRYTQGIGFIWHRDFDYLFPKKSKINRDTLQTDSVK